MSDRRVGDAEADAALMLIELLMLKLVEDGVTNRDEFLALVDNLVDSLENEPQPWTPQPASIVGILAKVRNSLSAI